MSWAHAPVAGRRACCVVVIDRRARLRWARPRSAVTVSPTAPAASSLTGFSRSGGPSSLGWLPLVREAPLRSLDLARVLRQGVDTRWTAGVPSVCAGGTSTCASATGVVTTTRWPLHVSAGYVLRQPWPFGIATPSGIREPLTTGPVDLSGLRGGVQW